jgi:hypothetical protein
MKVTGPNSGAGSPDTGKTGVGRAEEAGKPQGKPGVAEPESAGKAFAETLSGPKADSTKTNPARAIAEAKPAGALTGVADIAADLKAGRLQPKAAIEKVLDQILSRQLGADAPAGVREKVRAALQETLESDPLLAEKLRDLEG